MDLEKIRNMEKKLREQYVRELLGEERCKVLDKYGLYINDRLYFENSVPKYPTQEYFSLKFALKATPLGMVFQIYKLCFAKVKYFENNWNDFVPCIYDYKLGFIETELYNMEFIKQKDTNIVLDLRYLSTIHSLQVFKDLCAYLENEKLKSLGLNKVI